METLLSKYFNNGSTVRPVYVVEIWESGGEYREDFRMFTNRLDAAWLFVQALADGLNARYIETYAYTEPRFSVLLRNLTDRQG